MAVAEPRMLHSVRPISIQRRQIAFALGGSLAVLVALEASDVSLPAATKPLFLRQARARAAERDRLRSGRLVGSVWWSRLSAVRPAHGSLARPTCRTTVSTRTAPAVTRSVRATLSRSRDSIPDKRGFNVVWISIDALRADHVSAYGYSRRTTPNIDRLAREGIRFERAFVQSPEHAGTVFPPCSPAGIRIRCPAITPTLARSSPGAGTPTLSAPKLRC